MPKCYRRPGPDPGTELDSKLLATASTHNGPEVLHNNYVVNFPELQRAGVMCSLTKCWNAYPQKSEYTSSEQLKGADGQIYSVLTYANLIGHWYSKSILAQYHITTIPTTIAQMTADIKKVVAGGKFQCLAESGSPNVEGAWLLMPLLLDNGVNYCTLSSNRSKVTTAFTEVSQWGKDKIIPSATATWTQSDSWQEFVPGKFASGILGKWNLQSAKTQAKFPYGTAVLPSNHAATKSYVLPGREGLAVGAFSKHPSAAWKYLETPWLSKQGNITDFTASGQMPMRKDVAGSALIERNKLIQPLITAVSDSATGPNNPQTAAMQTGMRQVVRGVISGQLTPAVATTQVIANVDRARKAGGGGC